MKITGSEALWQCLLQEGVDTIFGYPGGAIMPVYDALYDFRDKIKHVLVRHEQGASHAAEGYARATGRAGVCLATSGPGATNLVTGIADAMMDSVPIVCITGQVFAELLGTDAFQETDIIGITMPITKWNYQITSAGEIPEILAKAFFIAQNGRPGPVLIDITKNAQMEVFEFEYKQITSLANFDPKPTINNDAVARAADLINKAEKPLLLVGHGVMISAAEKELVTFIEKTGIPAACTLHGLSSIAATHPLYVGMLGMHGNYGPNLLTNEADLIIGLGMRFDDRVTGKLKSYAVKAEIIHIDIDAAELNKNIPSAVVINADAKDTLHALIPLCQHRSFPAWLERFRACDAEEHTKVIARDTTPESGEIRMGEVIHQLSQKTGGDAILVADVGQHQMIAARYFKFKRSNSWISSGGLGTMGFAVPAAMGAQMGQPNRTVIAVAGDGGFQMTFQELGAIAQENLPVKMVILNNNFLGMVRQWQELFFEKRYSFVDIQSPNFVKLADAFEIPGARVDRREELDQAITKMLQSKGPYLLEVIVEKEDNVFPMVPAGASVSDIRLD